MLQRARTGAQNLPALLTCRDVLEFATIEGARCTGLVYHLGAFLAAYVPFAVALIASHSGTPLAHSMALVSAALSLGLAALLLIFRPRGELSDADPDSAPAAPTATTQLDTSGVAH